MISYIQFTSSSIVTQSGKCSRDYLELQELINQPMNLIVEQGFHVGLTIEKQRHYIYGWSPCQRLYLTDRLVITSISDTTYYPATSFWYPLLTHFQEVQEQLSPIPEIVRPYLGFYGYFAYELSYYLEEYLHHDRSLSYPLFILELPSRLLIDQGDQYLYIELDLPSLSTLDLNHQQVDTGSLILHGTKYREYLNSLDAILHHIEKGDIYQANYTQQFQVDKGETDPLMLYHQIIAKQHLPYAAFLNYGSLQIMSISPELFLHCHDGNVITKPIKGTRPRGNSLEEDLQFKEELQASDKDHAELSMIVDLLRNDLGKSAQASTVEVDHHAIIESYENVHHLVSTISAQIPKSSDASLRLLLRAFPGGSISGVPKLRALELIDQYETYPRGIYTGNIGFVGLTGDLDLNIAIRTAIFQDQQVTFNAGGGIVYDSDPVEEYIESLHKAKHLANYLGYSFIGHLVHFDGQIIEAELMTTEPTEQGVFETILVDHGNIIALDQHLHRLQQGLQYYDLDVNLPTPTELQQFIHLNVATASLIRLNIKVWRDVQDHVLISISPYQRPLTPVKLCLSKTAIEVPVSIQHGHKSLDYDQYKHATRSAIENNCWDMLLYDHNDIMLEGGRCTVYFYYNDQWITPRDNVVHGTIRQQLLDHEAIFLADLKRNQLPSVTSIAISNALIGIMPVTQIIQDGTVIWQSSKDEMISQLQQYLPMQV